MSIYKIQTGRLLVIAAELFVSVWLSSRLQAAVLNVATQNLPYGASLVGVACGQTCHAIGSSSALGTIEIADIGGKNLIQPVSTPDGALTLYGIACPPAPENQTCYTVGSGGKNIGGGSSDYYGSHG